MKRKYAGTWTALITPFKSDGSLDEAALRALVRRQAENGVTGIVPVGTTGESPTTTMEEDMRIFEIAVAECKGKGKGRGETGAGAPMVMAGTGSNCTSDAVHYTENALKAGCDACLVVSPYYNKPTPAGLKLHFQAVADVGLPVIVYNIKGRTGINIDTETLMEIAEHKNVVGVKEASGDLNQMKEVIERRVSLEGDDGDGGRIRDFTVLSGDDGLTLELVKMGGDGVISVASNIVPGNVSEMVKYALEGSFEEASKINEYLAKLFKDLFVETNPIPVKYLASRMGLCELVYRLPMCEPGEKARAVLEQLVTKYRLTD